jgi:ABC-type sugar transport system ATPase subunit
MAATTDQVPLVRLTGITKRFGQVTVLRDVSFEGMPGEVHILAGENGAGKSTLIKILAGIHTDFEGSIHIQGRLAKARSPLEAAALGIAVIHQELSLIGPMSVADNIFLGRTPVRGGFVLEEKQNDAALHWVRQMGLDIDVRESVEKFPVATRQLIEIAKALSQNARVIVMDEPTSALNAPEVKTLFGLIQSLKARGCCIIYITHKLEEIEQIADRITVLRDGQLVGSAAAADLPPTKLIQWMVGRDLGEQFPRRSHHNGTTLLKLENFSVFPSGFSERAAVDKISLSVRAGEVVGIGGVQGSGASELFLGIFGAYGAVTHGRMLLANAERRFVSPRQALGSGVALLTNDRKATGLVLSLSVTANATLAGLADLSPGGWRNAQREHDAAEAMTAPMRLAAAALDMEAGALSGGNQQKVALAKCLQIRPKLLMLDEPTRGIDVGAKREIYNLVEQWTAAGIAILLITSEIPELLTLSDRVAVMHRGRITAEFSREQATQESILSAAMGQTFAE